MTVAGDRPRLFNTKALLAPSNYVVVTEGELDAVTLEDMGVPAVGVPGAQAWQAHFREPFLGYRKVIVVADGDDAGLSFAQSIAKTLSNASVIVMPAGEDVNSLVQKEGPDEVLRRLQ
jgi:DNA primase